MFIVEITTPTGKVCEAYPTYEEARRRVEQFPDDALAGVPFIYRDLADGSQRLVREDGKPLQWHRLSWDSPEAPDEPLPLSEASLDLSTARFKTLEPDPDEPLPLCDDLPTKE